jgi:hypothetical protein
LVAKMKIAACPAAQINTVSNVTTQGGRFH